LSLPVHFPGCKPNLTETSFGDNGCLIVGCRGAE
jgi:hypothetical protein